MHSDRNPNLATTGSSPQQDEKRPLLQANSGPRQLEVYSGELSSPSSSSSTSSSTSPSIDDSEHVIDLTNPETQQHSRQFRLQFPAQEQFERLKKYWNQSSVRKPIEFVGHTTAEFMKHVSVGMSPVATAVTIELGWESIFERQFGHTSYANFFCILSWIIDKLAEKSPTFRLIRQLKDDFIGGGVNGGIFFMLFEIAIYILILQLKEDIGPEEVFVTPLQFGLYFCIPLSVVTIAYGILNFRNFYQEHPEIWNEIRQESLYRSLTPTCLAMRLEPFVQRINSFTQAASEYLQPATSALRTGAQIARDYVTIAALCPILPVYMIGKRLYHCAPALLSLATIRARAASMLCENSLPESVRDNWRALMETLESVTRSPLFRPVRYVASKTAELATEIKNNPADATFATLALPIYGGTINTANADMLQRFFGVSETNDVSPYTRVAIFGASFFMGCVFFLVSALTQHRRCESLVPTLLDVLTSITFLSSAFNATSRAFYDPYELPTMILMLCVLFELCAYNAALKVWVPASERSLPLEERSLSLTINDGEDAPRLSSAHTSIWSRISNCFPCFGNNPEADLDNPSDLEFGG